MTGVNGELMRQDKAVQLMVAEVDIQVATAKRYPRNVAACLKAAEDIITSSVEASMDAGFVKPVGKNKSGVMQFATGPSIRVMETIAGCWGNLRYGARIVDIGEDEVVIEAVVQDCERNLYAQEQIARSIRGRNGRYPQQVIDNTIASAQSIVLRKALQRVIPRNIVDQVMRKAEEKALGAEKQHEAMLKGVLKALSERYGVDLAMVHQALGTAPDAPITREQLLLLIKLGTSLRDGDTRVEDIWPQAERPAQTQTREETPKAESTQSDDLDPDMVR